MPSWSRYNYNPQLVVYPPTTYQHSNDKLGIWVTKDYLAVRYKDLKDDHLSNIINVLSRSNREYQYPRLLKMARRRGVFV